MAVTVTNSPILALSTVALTVRNAATSTVNGTAEVFTILPTAASTKMLVIIGGTGSGAVAATFAYSFAAGEFWAGMAKAGTVTKNTEVIIEIEGGHNLDYDGEISLTLTPGASDSLATTHSAYVKVVELL